MLGVDDVVIRAWSRREWIRIHGVRSVCSSQISASDDDSGAGPDSRRADVISRTSQPYFIGTLGGELQTLIGPLSAGRATWTRCTTLHFCAATAPRQDTHTAHATPSHPLPLPACNVFAGTGPRPPQAHDPRATMAMLKWSVNCAGRRCDQPWVTGTCRSHTFCTPSP